MKIRTKASIIALASILISVTMLSSCVYEEVLPEVIELPEGEVLSFSEDIQPIFDAKCNSIGCHNGNVAPNLLASDAYNDLITGNYINTGTPENSSLYIDIDFGGSMQLYATPLERAIILKWIEEGAQNN
ncbi:MAG: hypothetical protein JXQ96_14035 [Cyclobacteriaceae bacterium]